ncbi:YjhX family toxin [Roseicyclus persicicus]|uniref:UPF0386 protein HCU73_17380 n=1 Tax=Roseicyclus persicicus TaxID=2650661 RepID=A0A7X6H2X3_9RHOB|nr:YjhX family toxin [Roseibacterium persicicum]NKX46369.1 hypothetical protein [Roseibacterium persicicum]
MNISKPEQRVLHVLAQGGVIRADRGPGGKVTGVLCVTRDGLVLEDCTLPLFQRLRARRLIHSAGGRPYRISRAGRLAVRAQPDNR